MEKLELREIAAAMGGSLLREGDGPRHACGVAIDSRKVKEGDLFFAFPGERADGHDFVGAALAQGAAAAVVERDVAVDGPLIRVADTGKALQDLARWYRGRFDVPVVAVTGSCGKTTTKDMIAAALSGGWPVWKTRGNFNNQVGVPLTLLELDRSHLAAVVEMGMRGKGQIAELCDIARPTVGVLTNVGTVHMELLGSQEAIAEAKGELLEALPENGFAVINGSDPWVRKMALKTKGRVLVTRLADAPLIRDGLEEKLGDRYMGTLTANDITPIGQNMQFALVRHEETRLEVGLSLPVAGRHNMANALLAIGVGLVLGLSFEMLSEGLLNNLELSAMRQEVLAKGGFHILNDAYNANPEAMTAAVDLLKELAAGGRTIALLGDMFELGPAEEEGHRRVGRHVAGQKVDVLIAVGPRSAAMADEARRQGMAHVRHTLDKDEALDYLKELACPGDWVLLKGSRGMGMETILQGLD